MIKLKFSMLLLAVLAFAGAARAQVTTEISMFDFEHFGWSSYWNSETIIDILANGADYSVVADTSWTGGDGFPGGPTYPIEVPTTTSEAAGDNAQPDPVPDYGTAVDLTPVNTFADYDDSYWYYDLGYEYNPDQWGD